MVQDHTGACYFTLPFRFCLVLLHKRRGPRHIYVTRGRQQNLGVVFLRTNIEERACELAKYMIENNATVRSAANKFSISKSTVHKDLSERLEAVDRELFLRAEAALLEKNGERALALLDAAEDREGIRWHFLRGKGKLLLKDYALAAEHLQRAENAYPEQCIPLLEECFRELGDYKRAYEYACKQR